VQIKKQVMTLKTTIIANREKDLKAVKEALMKDAVLNSMSTAKTKLEEAETKITSIVDTSKSKDLKKDFSPTDLVSLKKKGEAALSEVVEAKEMIAKALKLQEELPPAIKGQLRDVRLEGAKLNSRTTTAERRCKAAIQPIEAAYEASVRAEVEQAKDLLRTACRKLDKTPSDIFAGALQNGGTSLSEEQFQAFVSGVPDTGLSSEQISILFNDVGTNGLNRLAFIGLLEEYMKCGKDVVMTKSCELNDELVRKVQVGEIMQILEVPKTEEDSDMKRAKCRAVRDNAIGWVSLQGNKGTSFLKSVGKPKMVCTAETSVLESFDSASAELYRLVEEEVFELLEGPKEHSPASEVYLNGMAAKDNKKGWILVSDSAGVTYASETTSLYKCVSATALTDSVDIQACKPLRKIDVGEILEIQETEEKPGEDSTVAQRVYVKAAKDGKIGWATIQGSRGTVFLKPDSQYKVQKSVAMRAAMGSEAKLTRQLEEGEMFTPIGAPKEQKPPGLIGIHVRSDDGQRSGWVVYMSGEQAPLEMRS
jgi:hypothetical protein